MGKHDDDDEEDEKSAYVSNSRLSRGGGGKEGDDEDEETLSPVIRAFCHHVVSEKFRKELDAFFNANCDEFEDADMESEQRLEWTMVFEKYVKIIEAQLEAFCGTHQLEPEGVFSMVQRACKSGMLDDEFLPSILGITEYPYFIEQIGLMASEPAHVKRATALATSAKDECKGGDDLENISGVWRVSTKDSKGNALTDVKGGLEKYLRAVGVPKSLHGLFKGTLFSKKGLVITHDDERETISFISDTITGRHKQNFRLDGEERQLPNSSGTKSSFTATTDRAKRIVIKNLKPSGMPRGSAIVQTWHIVGDMLQCTAEVERPNGVVMHEFFYVRATHKAKKQPREKKHK